MLVTKIVAVSLLVLLDYAYGAVFLKCDDIDGEVIRTSDSGKESKWMSVDEFQFGATLSGAGAARHAAAAGTRTRASGSGGQVLTTDVMMMRVRLGRGSHQIEDEHFYSKVKPVPANLRCWIEVSYPSFVNPDKADGSDQHPPDPCKESTDNIVKQSTSTDFMCCKSTYEMENMTIQGVQISARGGDVGKVNTVYPTVEFKSKFEQAHVLQECQGFPNDVVKYTIHATKEKNVERQQPGK